MFLSTRAVLMSDSSQSVIESSDVCAPGKTSFNVLDGTLMETQPNNRLHCFLKFLRTCDHLETIRDQINRRFQVDRILQVTSRWWSSRQMTRSSSNRAPLSRRKGRNTVSLATRLIQLLRDGQKNHPRQSPSHRIRP